MGDYTGPSSIEYRKWVPHILRLSHSLRTLLVLAVQNMEASGMIMKDQETEFNALCGSLSMMSKGVVFCDVRSDVVDIDISL